MVNLMKKCIVINGVSGSGKDTFIRMFAQLYDGKTANISSVDLVKDIMYDYMD
jgi:ABC-type proline/glycine betaine transport system ATPase subunit